MIIIIINGDVMKAIEAPRDSISIFNLLSNLASKG